MPIFVQHYSLSNHGPLHPPVWPRAGLIYLDTVFLYDKITVIGRDVFAANALTGGLGQCYRVTEKPFHLIQSPQYQSQHLTNWLPCKLLESAKNEQRYRDVSQHLSAPSFVSFRPACLKLHGKEWHGPKDEAGLIITVWWFWPL